MTRNNLRSFRSWLVTLTGSILAVILAEPSVAPAATDSWNTGSGNWSTAANWTNTSGFHFVPGVGDTVNITNSVGTNLTVTYDYTGAAITLASVTIDNTQGVTDTLSMAANTLTSSGMIIGNTGFGAMIQSGGTHTENGVIVLGAAAGSNGSYTITGSSSTQFFANGGLQVGALGTGTFTENGGSVSVSGVPLEVGSGAQGTYTLNSGSLAASLNEIVGEASNGTTPATGIFNQTGGTNTISSGGRLEIGFKANAIGTYNLSGGTLSGAAVESLGGDVDINKGNSPGTGTFNQTAGSNSTGEIDVSLVTGATGTYNLSGSSSNLSATNMFVGEGGTGTFKQTSGTSSFSNLVVGGTTAASGGTGVLNVSGGSQLSTGVLEVYNTTGSGINFSGGSISANSLNFNSTPSLFNWTAGTLIITANTTWDPGASPTSTSAAFGNSLSLGVQQTLNIGGNETLGGLGAFTLTVGTGANNTVSGNLTVNTGSQLYLSGGTLSVGNLITNGQFGWTTGTLNINGSQITTIGSGGPLGSIFTLGSGQNLTLASSTTVNAGSLLAINGGNFSTGTLTNSGNIALNSGSFTVNSGLLSANGSLLVIGENALAKINGTSTNIGEIQLGGEAATLTGTGSLENNHLIRGDGVISLSVGNNIGAEIRAEDGNRLEFTGTNGANLGLINLQGGTLEFTQALSNGLNAMNPGQISGRGTLIVDGGLTNLGNISFSAGISDVFGTVHNSTQSTTKGIVISGDANVTFWNPVTNGVSAGDGTLFKIAAGSTATFFGMYNGNGISGSGTAYYEAGMSPGFSPASISFGGNVVLDTTSQLQIELGGTTVGSQYDKINVADQLSLSGVLDVTLINGFTPARGNSFDIMDWGSLAGHFSSVSLPTLPAGLAWDSTHLYTTGALAVVSTSLLRGDFNRDGHVDAADILAAMKALTDPTGYEAQYSVSAATLQTIGDVNGDGQFTNADLQSLLIYLKDGGGSISTIPEPSTVALLGLGALAIAFRRRSC